MKVQAEAEAQRVKLIAQAEAEKLRVMGDAEAGKTKAVGDAEASKILAIGKSNAEAYELQVKAIGGNGFVQMKVAEIIGEKGVKIIPDVLITGGGEKGSGGNVIDLLGLKLLESWGKDKGNKLPEA